MRTPSVRKILRQRLAALTVAVFGIGLLVGAAGSAGAQPMPSISQVKAKLAKLQSESDRIGQQYDQVKQQLAATNKRLGLVNKQLDAYSSRFASLRREINRIAVTTYMNGNVNTSITLLTSGDPQKILNESSILIELSANDNAQIEQFLLTAKQLENAQKAAQRTKDGIVQLEKTLAARKKQAQKLVSQQQTLLAQLTPAQQATVGPGAGGTTTAKYNGPTATQAQKAVAFAFGALGCPYDFGGTSCSPGYDCSGLTMSAWAAAGVSIPRTSYDQWASLPHVSLSNLQPGDILVFNGAGHVGIYVGNNKLIDAPHTGLDVEEVSFTGWYRTTLDGAVRP